MLLNLKVQGVEKRFYAEIIDGKLWVHINGSTHIIEPESNSRTKKKQTSHNPNIIHAPMPGKITKLLVNPGQKVSRSEPLVVMEAMKMEYTLKSEIDSEVSEVKCNVGQQVNLGQILLELKS